MSNAINWFEIPTTDIARAQAFYETVLGVSLKKESFAGTPMAIFPAIDPAVGGALIADSKRRPSAEGSLVYLAAKDLDGAVARTKAAGGDVILPKTDIGEPGFIAIVRDTEGNAVGLHTPR